MAIYFVGRHKGALDWAKRKVIDCVAIEHMDVSAIKNGDIVYGTLPIHKVAELSERGGRYFHLTINSSPKLRGVELSADQLDELGATFVEYSATRIQPL